MATIEEQPETREPKPRRRPNLESRVDRIFDEMKIKRLRQENELLRHLVAELSLGKLKAEQELLKMM